MFKQIQGANQKGEESLDLLIQVWVRAILASVSLLVLIIAPEEAGTPVQFAYFLLVVYGLYSVGSALLYDTQELLYRVVSSRASHWIDTVFFSSLIALTGGADSAYFSSLFFPILAASFSWGGREGLKITIVSILLFAVSGMLSAAPSHGYEMNEMAMRPIFLLVFGYMVAQWGKGRIVLKQRLQLLQEVCMSWNPRFGVDHAVWNSLGKLSEFFRGSQCIMILHRAALEPQYVMYKVGPDSQGNTGNPKEVMEITAHELLSLPNKIAAAYESLTGFRFKFLTTHIVYDIDTFESTDKYQGECRKLSTLFDEESFISVPYLQQGVVGRIYLVARGSRGFNRSDVVFVKQVADALSSVVENMQLIEHLVAEAGEQERHRISLDVHDTTIQPYIGLAQALEALSREFSANEKLNTRLGEIIHMANMTVQDLRSYKDALRERSLMRGDSLVVAVRNQAGRLLRFYGVHVEVTSSVDVNLPGRVAEAALQIIKEGLSNMLRHTHAKKAFISMRSTDTHLLMEIGNEISDNSTVREFKPKSICERVSSLQGETSIDCNRGGYTVVHVAIPLKPQTSVYY